MYDRLSRFEGPDLVGRAAHWQPVSRSRAAGGAYYRIGRLVANLCARGHVVDRVDLGGGLGIPYHADDVVPTLDAYVAMVAGVTRGWNVELTFELGRVVPGLAGVLMTRVIW
jgi:diaminopimelate decarboxylase